MVRIIKISFSTMVGGVLGVVAVMTQGFGPCGPSSALGGFLLLAGIAAAAFGFLTVVVTFGWNSLHRTKGS
jgi:hypothetical protein